jgi:hypothetical protein
MLEFVLYMLSPNCLTQLSEAISGSFNFFYVDFAFDYE